MIFLIYPILDSVWRTDRRESRKIGFSQENGASGADSDLDHDLPNICKVWSETKWRYETHTQSSFPLGSLPFHTGCAFTCLDTLAAMDKLHPSPQLPG